MIKLDWIDIYKGSVPDIVFRASHELYDIKLVIYPDTDKSLIQIWKNNSELVVDLTLWLKTSDLEIAKKKAEKILYICYSLDGFI